MLSGPVRVRSHTVFLAVRSGGTWTYGLFILLIAGNELPGSAIFIRRVR